MLRMRNKLASVNYVNRYDDSEAQAIPSKSPSLTPARK
jgi:hypothetical protein